tara:strand:- start:198 stop:386 length:189 start_codon:yes stop_codon:yes gene_type:complete
MTKKHYQAIADALTDTIPNNYQDLPFFYDLIHQLCVIFEEDNSKFDSDKFRKATVEAMNQST